ncbi:MAG: septum formation initiator family protein [Bacteroidales bacterium]|nr:septum formation initiator family protein [Bacteroidales bacterium]
MKKDKDTRKQSFLRYAVIVTAVAVLFLFLKRDNVVHWVKAGITRHRQEARIEEYKDRINSLEERIHDLSTNRDSLEKYAREQYYFSVPGEDVYIEE